jgi:glycerol kinase
VALLAGVQAGILPGLEAWRNDPGAEEPRRFVPTLDPAERERWRRRWSVAVERSLHWQGEV